MKFPMPGENSRVRKAGLAWAGMTLLGLASACSPTNPAADAKASGDVEAVFVTLAPVAAEQLERTVSVVGTLTANAEARVAAETDGRLLSVDADLGDTVQQDEVLAQLDGTTIAAHLREAEALLLKARAEEKRAAKLLKRGLDSQQKFDEFVSQSAMAEARRDVLAINLAHSTIRAPFAGRIAERLADVGSFVRTGTPLFVLVAENPLRLRGDVPERYASEILVGADVRGRVAAFPDDLLKGKLTRISPAADPDRRALVVEAWIPNLGGRLKPGFFVKAEIVTRNETALLIPAESVTRLAGVERVWVVGKDSLARSRQVEIGDRVDTRVEVISGLEAGERIATSALSHLTEGSPVAVRQAANPGPTEHNS